MNAEILTQLKQMGNEGTARVLRNHGAHDYCLGVKIGDMKPLQKNSKRTTCFRCSFTIPVSMTRCTSRDSFVISVGSYISSLAVQIWVTSRLQSERSLTVRTGLSGSKMLPLDGRRKSWVNQSNFQTH
jgi:hypothetical protein